MIADIERGHIAYRVTENCDAGVACKARCFSQEDGDLPEDPSTLRVKTTVSHLKRVGVPAINFFGGEPTLREDLPELVQFAHEIGLQVIVSTNAIGLTQERFRAIAPWLDWLSLSLEADTPQVNNRLRGAGQWEGAMRVRDWMDEGDYGFRLKVNTQVTAVNHDRIDGIPDALAGKISVWKLLQWTPRAEARNVMDAFAVPADVYTATVARVRTRYPSLDIVERPWPETEPDAGIIRADGTFQVNGKMYDYVPIGNVYEEPMEVIFKRADRVFADFRPANVVEFHDSYPAGGGSI